MNNKTSITQEQKQYIIFNLKRFFEYYKLEENIIKANEDNKMINKMKGEVDNLLNFIPERLRTKLLNNIHHSSKHKEVIKSEDIAYRRIPNSKNNINQIKKIYYLASCDENIQILKKEQEQGLTDILLAYKKEHDNIKMESKKILDETERLEKKIKMIKQMDTRTGKKNVESKIENENIKKIWKIK